MRALTIYALAASWLALFQLGCRDMNAVDSRYREAVTRIAESEGVKTYPSSWKEEKSEGCKHTYVTVSDSGDVSVLFVEWIGKGANMRGTLFSEEKLVRGDMVALLTYSALPPPDMPQVNETIAEIAVDEVIGPNWYRVSRSMD